MPQLNKNIKLDEFTKDLTFHKVGNSINFPSISQSKLS